MACSPGLADHSWCHQIDQTEWDRVMTRIAHGWQRIGFQPYRDNVMLLSPASLLLEEQRSVLRQEFAELGAAWRVARARAGC
ncbi:hypothetical protein [Streptomyces sp. NPDC058268]|uniref:hypothetical protein n=1 Tax=Streptomyces sp. NPDC058268 TaxID=3346413 RepID=UPI0036F155E2